MKTIRWIISLVDKKAQALVAVLLIGLSIAGGVIKYMHDQSEKDRIEWKKELAACESLRIQELIQHGKEKLEIKEAANKEVKDYLVQASLKLEDKMNRMENVKTNSMKAQDDAKHIERTQSRIINKLKINN